MESSGMNSNRESRRRFLKAAAISSAAILLPRVEVLGKNKPSNFAPQADSKPADSTLRIKISPVEIAPNRIISMTTYNGQFPGPLVRLKEGQPVTVTALARLCIPKETGGSRPTMFTEDIAIRLRSFDSGISGSEAHVQ